MRKNSPYRNLNQKFGEKISTFNTQKPKLGVLKKHTGKPMQMIVLKNTKFHFLHTTIAIIKNKSE